jgi:hypothetical protein
MNQIDRNKKFDEVLDDGYKRIGDYVNNKKNIKVKHKVCGNIYEKRADKFMYNKSYRCPECYGYRRLSHKELENIVEKEGYSLLNHFENMRSKIKLRHNKCGNEWTLRASNFIYNNTRCPECSKISMISKKVLTEDIVRKNINSIDDSDYIWIDGLYETAHSKLTIKHKSCGHEWDVSYNNLTSLGTRCPKCANSGKPSKLEIEIFTFLNSIYDGEIIQSDKSILDGLELDMYIPDAKMAIEFDGLYWHSEKNGKNRNYHLNKTMAAKEKGIHLIHIFEDEWNNKKDIVKSKLKHILGYNNGERIYARKCEIREVSPSVKNKFLEENHIQGKDQSKYKLGLFYQDELISIITFGSLRISLGSKSKENSYELIRFASKKDKIIIGGFSKLLKYFIKNYEPEYIKTFADLRWSKFNSNLYDMNGFKLSHQSKPNYWYLDSSRKYREHRFRYRKNILGKILESFDPKMTEVENMYANGYDRIWDCGNLVYEWSNN